MRLDNKVAMITGAGSGIGRACSLLMAKEGANVVALEKFGCIDILVNNAGILLMKSLLDTTEEEWDRVQTVNLKSVFLCSKRAIPEMLKNGKGKIVNIASPAARLGAAGGHYR